MTNPLTTRSVLVVDDDRPLCELLAEILTEAGYAVRCVYDGEAAWLEIQTQPPDLILSDITMPRLDGISLARRLAETGSSIPIILMSSAVTAVAGVNGDGRPQALRPRCAACPHCQRVGLMGCHHV